MVKTNTETFHHIQSSYPNISKLRELEKGRNFVGRTEKQRRSLENNIKKRYNIEDFETEYGLGYRIYDKKKNEYIFFSPNSRLTLETRYLEKDENRVVSENVLDLFTRVAANIAEADLKYDKNKDIKPIAEEFLESLVYKEFMPNTPTLCNAGRSLGQLSACFVLPIEDYMATDDIGEDPEKQGNGIFDMLRGMSMIHKSGGGTGFNFSHLRPKTDRIATTFGSSSGPVSFMMIFDAATNGVNQGGFRRGANMAILNYNHPDIFEFTSKKSLDKTALLNFNLSVGVDDEFMKAVENDGYFKMINPKNENKISLEKRIWKKQNLLQKGTQEYEQLFNELEPSLIISEDGKKVINVFNGKEVGKISEDDFLLIRARTLYDDIIENAWTTGCPGVVFLDRLEKNNKTPHIGKIESTNPCGEQPLLGFEACNLGAVNLATCVKEGKIDYSEIERRVALGVHFLDNVIDMNKFPFQKIYGIVHGNRKIGLGLMGFAEMLAQLKIPYDSNEAVNLAKDISNYITKKAREKTMNLAEERGVFPFWEGSVWEKEGIKVRNAVVTTIAPNGTTGMISDVTGGIEPFFKLAYKKICMDGKELVYRVPLFESDLYEKYGKENLEDKIKSIDKEGSIQNSEIDEELKKVYKNAHDISPEWHVKIQAAFQSGIDNAVSKTVNLPNEATFEDVKKVYDLAYKEGCMGITIFRDGCKQGVYSGLENKIELVQKNVKDDPRLEIKAQALKYKVHRPQNGDSLHIIPTSDLYVDDENNKAYFIPCEMFQERVPLGDARSVSFQQAGIERTSILKENPDPNYVEIIRRLQSASSSEEEGLGPMKIKSIEHAAGLVLEDYLLRNGVIGHDEATGKLINLVRKKDLRKVEYNSDEFKSLISQVRISRDEKELIVMGNQGKLGQKFICEQCGGEEYTFEAGCNHPKCKECGWIYSGGCG